MLQVSPEDKMIFYLKTVQFTCLSFGQIEILTCQDIENSLFFTMSITVIFSFRIMGKPMLPMQQERLIFFLGGGVDEET